MSEHKFYITLTEPAPLLVSPEGFIVLEEIVNTQLIALIPGNPLIVLHGHNKVGFYIIVIDRVLNAVRVNVSTAQNDWRRIQQVCFLEAISAPDAMLWTEAGYDKSY